jgi:hypothetical protein
MRKTKKFNSAFHAKQVWLEIPTAISVLIAALGPPAFK